MKRKLLLEDLVGISKEGFLVPCDLILDSEIGNY
jgi:hypothetical protein